MPCSHQSATKSTIHVRVEQQRHLAMRLEAARQGISLQRFAESVIADGLKLKAWKKKKEAMNQDDYVSAAIEG